MHPDGQIRKRERRRGWCGDKISDVTAHEQFIEQLQTDYLLRNKLVNALQKLNKPDAYSIVDILAEKEHTYSRGYLLLLQICRWLPAVSLILMFQIPSSGQSFNEFPTTKVCSEAKPKALHN